MFGHDHASLNGKLAVVMKSQDRNGQELKLLSSPTFM